jgi:hypothetical protein
MHFSLISTKRFKNYFYSNSEILLFEQDTMKFGQLLKEMLDNLAGNEVTQSLQMITEETKKSLQTIYHLTQSAQLFGI